ncbi:hypothetical protein [Massilia sp. NR 4-1]|uniref:hypothetical protein n=1 Tax=Massilia sp. NR 4-1 TaxID=1678028 RepID=UPI00067C1B13|nr:hypothetical protein [Massilia sp. NR 4-1]AKU21354.1 agglutinin biogenesis protein MshI [Massilia sp. NR 4-1]
MRFFSKAKKKESWLTISFLGDGICVVEMLRAANGRPKVEVAAFYPGQPSYSPELLQRLGRELRAEHFYCATLLGGGEYQLLTVEAPNVAQNELKTAVRWRLKDLLDFHIDDATIDVLDIPMDKSAAAGRPHSMFAVAARNSLIESRQGLFDEAGLLLRVIDIPEMAQRNIATLLETEGRGVGLLSFDEDGGLLTISSQGELYLSRRIEVTLQQLLDPNPNSRAIYFDKIALELQRSLDHFERQYHFITISRLLLAPSAAVGLDTFLAQNLYIPVESLNLDAIFDLEKVPELAEAAQQQRFFLALGAAMRTEEVVL